MIVTTLTPESDATGRAITCPNCQALFYAVTTPDQRIRELETQLAATQGMLETMKRQRDSVQLIGEELIRLVKLARDERDAARRMNDGLVKGAKTLRETITELEQKLSRAEAQRDRAEARCTDYAGQLNEARGKLSEQQTTESAELGKLRALKKAVIAYNDAGTAYLAALEAASK